VPGPEIAQSDCGELVGELLGELVGGHVEKPDHRRSSGKIGIGLHIVRIPDKVTSSTSQATL
jgi:hypothetical protein